MSLSYDTRKIPREQLFRFTAFAPRRWHLGYSPFGRWIRRITADPIVAENRVIYWVVLMLVGLIIAGQFVWAVVSTAVVSEPTGPAAITFWLGLVFVLAGAGFGLLFGFKPAFELRADGESITLRGEKDVRLPYRHIRSVSLVTSFEYHRRYRRQHTAVHFVNRVDDHLVLIDLGNRVVLVGLRPADTLALHSFLRNEVRNNRRVLDLQPAQVA